MNLQKLKECQNRSDLARALGVMPSHLSYVLYHASEEQKYKSFSIPKKNGGDRKIMAPIGLLKNIQRALADLLMGSYKELYGEDSDFCHGFIWDKSCITNARLHVGKKLVANLDLESYFDSFNFGRVRGFFIKNKDFSLDPYVATILAQIACHKNVLPQGAPCSPVITNLITRSLDLKILSVAKRYSFVYSRYADDLTFSTRKRSFHESIVKGDVGSFEVGDKLKKIIEESGFSINQSKFRVQLKDSRQDVTGLVVNSKLGVPKEYWRKVRAQCSSLFKTGRFLDDEEDGDLHVLEGRLSYIDSIDRSIRFRNDELIKRHGLVVPNARNKNSRERTYGDFLIYKNFFCLRKPMIICEGKTDNVYLKCAIRKSSGFKYFLQSDGRDNYSLFTYSKRTKFLMGLGGGYPELKNFIENFPMFLDKFDRSKVENPVIVVLDNDDALSRIRKLILEKYSDSFFSDPPDCFFDNKKFRSVNYVRVIEWLYIVPVPQINNSDSSEIENLFTQDVLDMKYKGRSFSMDKNQLSKQVFSKQIVFAKRESIDFSGFNTLLKNIDMAIDNFHLQ